MIADRFDNRSHAGIPDGETFARHAADVNFAAGRAVKGDIANDDVFLWLEGRALRRIDDNLAARQAFADVIVGVAFEAQRHTPRNEGTEALAG